jgi:ABC-type bacteriocin/lantibiotic exporter with double-glycine peptidase domain
LDSTLKKLSYLLTGFRKRFLVTSIVGAITITLDTVSLIYFGSLVAAISGQSKLIDQIHSITDSFGISPGLQVLVGILFVMYVLKSGMQLAFNRSISRLAYDVRISLQTRLLKGVLVDIPYRQLSSNSSAAFSSKVMHVANGFSSDLILQGSIGLINAVTGAFIFVYLLIINPRPTLVLAAAFAFIGLVYVKTMTEPLRRLGHNLHNDMSRLTKIFMDSFYSAKDARVHSLQQNYLDLADGYLVSVKENHLKYNTIQMLPRVSYEILLCLSFLIFTIGSDLSSVSTPALMTQFSIFLIASIKMLPAVSQMVSAIAIYNSNFSSIDILYNEIKPLDDLAKEKILQTRDETPCKDQWNTIKFSDISFAFDAKKPVLNNVNLTIPQGHVIGISGASGGGKSTLLDILLGLLEPDSGQVLINGINLSLCKQSWNEKIGYMSQNLFLIDESVRQNLTLSEPKSPFDNERAKSCLLEVGLHNFANEEGLQFKIGERGIRLSGGQRQRLAIARLLYSQKTVLILDEPTASLDKQAEQAVIQCIQSIKGRRTIIVVSHSENLLNECELIYEVRNSSVEEIKQLSNVS